MYLRLDNCPSCQQAEFKNQYICKDYLVSNESFAIVKCENCNLLFTNPRPSIERIAHYYGSTDYSSHKTKTKSIKDLVYNVVRYVSIRNKFKLVSKITAKKSVLDIGCGTGKLLKYFLSKGWEVAGMEPNESARKAAEQGLNKSINENLAEIKNTYPVITLWHVLEHVENLQETLNQISNILEKKGHLVLALPNHKSFDGQYYKEYWAGYDVPRHLYHFDPKTIKQILKTNGFKLISTKPLMYDSYYISLISEKYKTGKSNILRAFQTGYKSNKMARTDTNYSSNIYIFQKKK